MNITWLLNGAVSITAGSVRLMKRVVAPLGRLTPLVAMVRTPVMKGQ